MPEPRLLGLVGDGPSDQVILRAFVETACPNQTWLFHDLSQKLHDAFQQLRRNFAQDSAFRDFCSVVRPALLAAVKDMWSNAPEGHQFSARDLLLVQTDSEHLLPGSIDYWQGRPADLVAAVQRAIDLFCADPMHQGQRALLPQIVPVVFFPSTEILLAAAAQVPDFRRHKPSELKRRLYKSERPRLDDIEKMAQQALRTGNLDQTLEAVPECWRLHRLLAAL